MQQVIIFDGQDVLEQDTRFLETSKSNEIRRRNRDEASSFGIIADSGDTKLRPLVISPFTLQLSAGSAYDGNGDYINIPGLPTAALPTVAFTALDAGKIIVLRYLSIDTDTRAHPVTGVASNTRRKDSGTYRNPDGTYTVPTDEIGPAYTAGFSLLLEIAPLSTDVRLGRIVSVDGGGGAALDFTVARSYDPAGMRYIYSSYIAGIFNERLVAGDPIDAFMDHINSFGSLGMSVPLNPHGLIPSDIGAASGTVNLVLHERELHSSGLIGDSRGTTGLDMVINGAAPPNTLTVVNLLPTDVLVIDGNDIFSLTGSLTLSFTSEVSNSTFEIFVLANGTVDKNKIADLAITPSPITGVQIAEVVLGSIVPPASAGLSLDGTVSPKTLRFQFGPQIQIPTTGYYKLPGDNPSSYIIVHAHVPTLPGGTPSDSINLYPQIDRESFYYVIGTVWWSGSATGILGYGNGLAAGVPRSLKKFGNIKSRNVHDDYQAQIDRAMSELRSDGMLYVSDFGFTPAGFFLGVSPGTVYINGRKITVNNQFGVTLPNATAFNQVWVDSNGVLQFGATLPSPRPQTGVNVAAGGPSDVVGFVFLGTVTTSVGVGITATSIVGRVIIGDLDAVLINKNSGISGARRIGQEIGGFGNTVHDALTNLNAIKGGLATANVWTATNTYSGLVNFKRTSTSPGIAPSWQIEQPDGGESLTLFEGFHTGATPRNLFSVVNSGSAMIIAYRTRLANHVGPTWEQLVVDQNEATRLKIQQTNFKVQRPLNTNNPLAEADWQDVMGLALGGIGGFSGSPRIATPEKIPKVWGKILTDGAGGFSTNVGVNVTATLGTVPNRLILTIPAGIIGTGSLVNMSVVLVWGSSIVTSHDIAIVGSTVEVTPFDVGGVIIDVNMVAGLIANFVILGVGI